jgi:gamma-glutamyltranspeptidase
MEFSTEELQIILRALKHTYSDRTDTTTDEVIRSVDLYERIKKVYNDQLWVDNFEDFLSKL